MYNIIYIYTYIYIYIYIYIFTLSDVSSSTDPAQQVLSAWLQFYSGNRIEWSPNLSSAKYIKGNQLYCNSTKKQCPNMCLSQKA